jgi:hypothetical protein
MANDRASSRTGLPLNRRPGGFAQAAFGFAYGQRADEKAWLDTMHFGLVGVQLNHNVSGPGRCIFITELRAVFGTGLFNANADVM